MITTLSGFSISSRTELTILAKHLASGHQVAVIGWPDFGDSDRPRLGYQPHFYQQFLKNFVTTQFSAPISVIAIGHTTLCPWPTPSQNRPH